MKIKSKIIYNINAMLGIFAILLLAHPAKAQIKNANEFWISTNATGNMLSSGAGGTIDSPLDGSTQPHFDANMDDLPPNSIIHVMAGTYQTHGIEVRSGIQILGSGIDVTVLQFPPGTPNGSVVIVTAGQSGVACTNNVVSDLTCDCNYSSGSYTYSGIGLAGTKHTIRRVKLINAANMGNAVEAWGLMIANWTLDHSDGNTIEECEISGFNHATPGTDLCAIGFISGSGISEPVGILRNNHIFATDSDTSLVFGLIAQSGDIVEDNYVDGAYAGSRSENAETNVLFLHNVFKNCEFGIYFLNGGYRNLTFAFNQIEVTNTFAGASAFCFGAGGSDTNIVLIGNNVMCLGPTNSVSSCYFNRIQNVTGLTILDNTADAGLLNDISNCENLNIDHNYDLYGSYLTDLNIPSIGGVPVTSFGLGLLGSAGVPSALASLGLPSTLTEMITNNSTGVMLSGSFGGNGGGLTNVAYLAAVGRVGANSDGTSFTFGGGSGIVSSLSFGTNSSAERNSLAFANGTSLGNSLAFAGGQASSDSLAFGINHSNDGADGEYAWASHGSLAFGYTGYDSAPFPYADSNSIAVGNGVAEINGFAMSGAGAYVNSFGYGLNAIATNFSFAFGNYATAANNSYALGGQAFASSFAVGAWADATNGSLAFCFPNQLSHHAYATNFQWVAAGFTGGYIFNDGPFNIGNNLKVGGTISGNGSGLTGITGTSIATDAGISLNALKMPASTLAYGSNGVASVAFLGPNLTVQNYTNVAGGVTNIGSTLLLKSFISQEYSIASGVVANIKHGLSNTPSNVRWVVVCRTNDVGYSVGDELNVASVDANTYPAFSSGANSTNVFLIFDDNASAFEIANKSTGARQNGVLARWKAKCYASP